MNLKIKILSWLLHHANKLSRNERFYLIKNKILSKYGTHIQYDVQFIEGKRCFTCDGTGIYDDWDKDDIIYCDNCIDGWYHRPVWNILAKVQFSKYQFHQPYKRVFVKPEFSNKIIEGYINHNTSNYSNFAITVLFLLYDKTYLKRMWKSKTCNFFNEITYFKINIKNKIKGIHDDALPF